MDLGLAKFETTALTLKPQSYYRWGEAEPTSQLVAHLGNWSFSQNEYHSYGNLLVITGYFYGIIHSINGVFLVLITGITRAITAGQYKTLKCIDTPIKTIPLGNCPCTTVSTWRSREWDSWGKKSPKSIKIFKKEWSSQSPSTVSLTD